MRINEPRRLWRVWVLVVIAALAAAGSASDTSNAGAGALVRLTTRGPRFGVGELVVT